MKRGLTIKQEETVLGVLRAGETLDQARLEQIIKESPALKPPSVKVVIPYRADIIYHGP